MLRRLLLLGVVLALSAACHVSPPAASLPRSLAGPWKFQPGDDPRWADPAFNDQGWTTLQVPRSWGRQGFNDVYGMAWYRVRVPLPWPADQPIGLSLGKIDSAYEVFAGGRKIGSVGRLPPNPQMMYDRHGIYVVPASTREADGSVLIALRVWRAEGKSAGAAGPVEGPFEIGPVTEVLDRERLSESAQLAVVCLFVVVGLFHIALGVLRSETAGYGWFGLLALESAVYAFMRSQWKYLFFDDFVAVKKAEHLMIYLVPATFVQFLWVFFGRQIPKPIRALQIGQIVAGAVIVLWPGLDAALTLLPAVQIAAFTSAGLGTLFVIPFIRRGDPEARLVGLGALCIVLTLSSDFLIERNFYVAPRTVVYGFAMLVFGMTFAIANRFHRVLAEVETLRRELEARVTDRTRELSAAYTRMEELALRDGLTGLLNRRALQERAKAGLSKARRRRTSFALAMIDIDHFKMVNDTHGHVAGDRVLSHVARVLSEGVRESDDVGRWGGEEFLVLLPESTLAEAEAAAERLLERVEASACDVDGRSLRVTVSIGLAMADAGRVEPTGLDDLIRVADDALYRAKAQGRNRVARIA